MVIRVEQCTKFEAIPSIMHGTPQFDPFHQFKVGQEWRVERRKIPRLPGSLDHYSAPHYSDVIMSAMASQITGVLIAYSTVCSGADQRKHQSAASLVCVRGIPSSHRWIPAQKPVTQTCFHLVTSSWKQEIWMQEMSAPPWNVNERSPVEMCLMNKINSHAKEFGREISSPTIHSSFIGDPLTGPPSHWSPISLVPFSLVPQLIGPPIRYWSSLVPHLIDPPYHWSPISLAPLFIRHAIIGQSQWSPISLVPHLIGSPSHWSPNSSVPHLIAISTHASPVPLVPHLIGPPDSLVPHLIGTPSHWSPSHWSPNS